MSGLAHERAFVHKLRGAGFDVVAIPENDVSISERARLTEDAMRADVDASRTSFDIGALRLGKDVRSTR